MEEEKYVWDVADTTTMGKIWQISVIATMNDMRERLYRGRGRGGHMNFVAAPGYALSKLSNNKSISGNNILSLSEFDEFAHNKHLW